MSRQAALAFDRCSFDIRGADLKRDRLGSEHTVFRKPRMDREPHVTLCGNLPQHTPGFVRNLLQFEVAGAHFVAMCTRWEMRDPCQHYHQKQSLNHCRSAAFAMSPDGNFASARGFG